MSETKHTALPWDVNTQAGPERTEVFSGDHLICDTKISLAHIYPLSLEQAEANAEFINRAANCHDELLAALKVVSAENWIDLTLAQQANWLRKSATAIAKAEGRAA